MLPWAHRAVCRRASHFRCGLDWIGRSAKDAPIGEKGPGQAAHCSSRDLHGRWHHRNGDRFHHHGVRQQRPHLAGATVIGTPLLTWNQIGVNKGKVSSVTAMDDSKRREFNHASRSPHVLAPQGMVDLRLSQGKVLHRTIRPLHAPRPSCRPRSSSALGHGCSATPRALRRHSGRARQRHLPSTGTGHTRRDRGRFAGSGLLHDLVMRPSCMATMPKDEASSGGTRIKPATGRPVARRPPPSRVRLSRCEDVWAMVLGHQGCRPTGRERALHRVQGARNSVAHAALLHLFMHQHVHAMAWVEVL